MTCQFCGSSYQLIFIGSKSVSVYRHVAGVSAAAHNEVDPTRGVLKFGDILLGVTLTPDTST